MGLSHTTTPDHVSQALREAVVFRLAEVVRRLGSLLGWGGEGTRGASGPPSTPTLVLSGKAVLCDPEWRHAFVHTLAAPVWYVVDTEPAGPGLGGDQPLEATSLGCLAATLHASRASGRCAPASQAGGELALEPEAWPTATLGPGASWACDGVEDLGRVVEFAEAYRRHQVVYDALASVQPLLAPPAG